MPSPDLPERLCEFADDVTIRANGSGVSRRVGPLDGPDQFDALRAIRAFISVPSDLGVVVSMSQSGNAGTTQQGRASSLR